MSPLDLFHPVVAAWFAESVGEPTPPQAKGWPAIARGESTLILSPTGSGKTLAAFLWAIDRVMFSPVPDAAARCRVLYVSPLKALAVDVERNLRAPIAGITALAARRGAPAGSFVVPAVSVRTGDTPASERARFAREPADILITTPESLYLLLTSKARRALASVETVIVDEIHALVPTKRGAHLALSLERLQAICPHPLQRIGLSATQRPLDEVARFLGGAEGGHGKRAKPCGRRPATPQEALRGEFGGAGSGGVSAGHDRGRETAQAPCAEGRGPGRRPGEAARAPIPADGRPRGAAAQSIWASIHPRLLELVRSHRSTLLFVNSRRLAERLAAALNDLAGGTIARAHHGSLAREQRAEIEEALKAGRIPALVATSSLELGIDMGAIDLVVQIEAPPSVASGLQRIGRASHQVDAVSEGVVFPKFRGDLVACAAVTRAMHEGLVEPTRYPRNPLDVLAQQVVAMAAMDTWRVDDLLAVVRSAAPYAELSRGSFEGVLDMLSGRYPSDEFAELRPRVTWDRTGGTLTARQGAARVAVVNAGTIPDRGLYGVFLAGAPRGAARVGELDEEMVFESRVGDTFVLGATTWRIEEITHDRVLVSPAPGEPGRAPFWHGDRPGRPLELGLAIGRLTRDLRAMPKAAALGRLVGEHDLDRVAAENLLQYLADQHRATQAVPDDRTIVIERSRDELGDWRVCLLAPFGARVIAPWAMAAQAHIRERLDLDVETMWSDDGFVARFPDTGEAPETGLLLPSADDVERLLVQELGGTSLYAARFREAAARALLLPRRRPGARAPLWKQRKRASDLLAVAARFGSFPIVLETYRECLRDQFDVQALVDLLARVGNRSIRTVTVDTDAPSPFAASLLFSYTANFLYDGDAPLAERRAQALLVDQSQLRELLGDIDLGDLLDPAVIDEIEAQLQHLDPRARARSGDALHDLLLRIGDLDAREIRARAESSAVAKSAGTLVAQGRVIELLVGGARRLVAVEDAARYRDAVGATLPAGLPASLLEPVADPLGDLTLRYARTHGPFTAEAAASRFGLEPGLVAETLRRLAARGRVLRGRFRPGRAAPEWCEADVLRQVRRRSLAKLRHEVEPVDSVVLGRLAVAWHGLTMRRSGLDALLDVVDQLQGAPLVASLLEREVLPARLDGYRPGDLDVLASAGEVGWVGLEPLGDRDGRVALFLADDLPTLQPVRTVEPELDAGARTILEHLQREGPSHFPAIHEAAGGGYPRDTLDALWNLVWIGLVTNDTFHPLRAFARPLAGRARRHAAPLPFRSRRQTPPAAEGRWTLVGGRVPGRPTPTRWAAAVASQLLARHGLVTRETVSVEHLPGGFAAVYDVLKAMEDAGRVRRGYFVSGLGATQFALSQAVELLRSLREEPDVPQTVCLAATDPANVYGAILKWPERVGRGPTRSAGAIVVLVNGLLAAYVGRADRQFLTFVPDDEPARGTVSREVAGALFRLATGAATREGMLIGEIDDVEATAHPLAPYLLAAGFVRRPGGFQASHLAPRTLHSALAPST